MVRHGGEHHPPFSHTYADVPSKLEEHPVILAEKWRSSEIARKVGTTEYEGYQCDIIRHEGTETTDSPLMQWVARDTGFPVRTEVPEKLYLLEYRNIDERPVPVSAFSIPPGYRKVETPVP